MYGETEVPSASMVVPDDIFQVSTQDLAGYLSFRPKLLLQDPSDIMAVSKRRLTGVPMIFDIVATSAKVTTAAMLVEYWA